MQKLKTYSVFTFLCTLATTFCSAQIDTASSLDILYQNAQTKQIEKEHQKHILGCSLFGGLGFGGNDPKTGFAQGLSVRVHYNIHTVNVYSSWANKSDQVSGIGYTNSLNSKCSGVTYGIGFYEKKTSASIGVGIGYCQTMVYHPSNDHPQGPEKYYYNQMGICLGGQLTYHFKYIGFTLQSFVNISSSIANYTALAGLEFMLNDLIKTKPKK